MKLIDYGAPDFDLREFIPSAVFKQYGKNSIWFMDTRVFEIVQEVKDLCTEVFGENSTVVNNWHYGGSRNWSGYRTVDWINQQIQAGRKVAKLTQHLRGAAFDLKVFVKDVSGVSKDDLRVVDGKTTKEIKADAIRREIKRKEELFIGLGLTTLESGKYAPTWVHGDTRHTGKNELLIVGA